MTPNELTPHEEEMLERMTESDDPRDWTDGDPDDMVIEEDYDTEDDSWSDADSLASCGWGEDEAYTDICFEDSYGGGYDV